MSKKTILLASQLQLFDGAAGGGEGGGQGGSAGALAGVQGQPESSQPEQTGGEPTVLYGIQPEQNGNEEDRPAAGDQQESLKEEKTTRETQKERLERYRELMDGEFKDIHQKETQRMINRRFKETKDLQEKLESYQPILDNLMDRYGIRDGDITKLQEAVDHDRRYLEEAAEDAGMTVEQYAEFRKLQRENDQFKQMQLRRQADESAKMQVRQWVQEAEELKQDYPDFDLDAFVNDPQNVEYLRHHVPMRMIYEFANREAIQANVAAHAAQQTEKNVVEGIRAKGQRPKENGSVTQPGVIVKTNVDELTNEDIDRIIRLVQQGEKISF